jgi:2-phosphoxylose phosphatase
MDIPRRPAAIAGATWISRLVAFLGILLILQIVVQEVIALRSHPILSALVAATTFRHYNIAVPSVDLGWYPPNATVINNLTNVLDATGVCGFIYNNSYPTDVPYGTYNWCNMPHVRKEEYTKPSDQYRLIYVELVSLID